MARIVTWIGPWQDDDHPDRPWLEDHIDEGWGRYNRAPVATHLEDCGYIVDAPRDGYTSCFFCHQRMYRGFVRTDGVFMWRTGLGHYVQEHSLRLPQPFLDHVEWIIQDPDPDEVDEEPWWLGVDPYSSAGVEVARNLCIGPTVGSWEINTSQGHDPSKPMDFDALKLDFWAEDHDPNSPHYEDHIDPDWDEREREAVEVYLDQDGLILGASLVMGRTCLLCGKSIPPGFIRTDGVYVWQTGLVHYVRDHHVRPPQPLIDRVNQVAREIADLQTDDMQWWDNDPYSHDIAVS